MCFLWRPVEKLSILTLAFTLTRAVLEREDDTFLRHVKNYLPTNAESHPRRPRSESFLLQESL